jgi:putative membrane protein
MIRSYSDHAANERTFLAWVRTGIAVVAFGFVVERFNLFVIYMARTEPANIGHRATLEQLSGPLGRYEGLTLTLVGLALIVTAGIRFVRVGRLIEDEDTHDAGGYRAELALSIALALIIATSSIYLVFNG